MHADDGQATGKESPKRCCCVCIDHTLSLPVSSYIFLQPVRLGVPPSPVSLRRRLSPSIPKCLLSLAPVGLPLAQPTCPAKTIICCCGSKPTRSCAGCQGATAGTCAAAAAVAANVAATAAAAEFGYRCASARAPKRWHHVSVFLEDRCGVSTCGSGSPCGGDTGCSCCCVSCLQQRTRPLCLVRGASTRSCSSSCSTSCSRLFLGGDCCSGSSCCTQTCAPSSRVAREARCMPSCRLRLLMRVVASAANTQLHKF